EDGRRPRRAEPLEHERRGADREPHLERAAGEHARHDAAEVLERELDPDAEEEERHAELRELLDRRRVPDPPQAARARKPARRERRAETRCAAAGGRWSQRPAISPAVATARRMMTSTVSTAAHLTPTGRAFPPQLLSAVQT